MTQSYIEQQDLRLLEKGANLSLAPHGGSQKEPVRWAGNARLEATGSQKSKVKKLIG